MTSIIDILSEYSYLAIDDLVLSKPIDKTTCAELEFTLPTSGKIEITLELKPNFTFCSGKHPDYLPVDFKLDGTLEYGADKLPIKSTLFNFKNILWFLFLSKEQKFNEIKNDFGGEQILAMEEFLSGEKQYSTLSEVLNLVKNVQANKIISSILGKSMDYLSADYFVNYLLLTRFSQFNVKRSSYVP